MRTAAVRRLLAGIIFLAFSSVTIAQDAPWEETTNAGRTAEFQGRPAEAEKLYLAALNKAEAFGPLDSRLAASLENLGMFYFARAKHSEAESLLRRAFEIRQKSEGASSFEMKRVRANLAGILQAQGKDQEAGRFVTGLERTTAGAGTVFGLAI